MTKNNVKIGHLFNVLSHFEKTKYTGAIAMTDMLIEAYTNLYGNSWKEEDYLTRIPTNEEDFLKMVLKMLEDKANLFEDQELVNIVDQLILLLKRLLKIHSK